MSQAGASVDERSNENDTALIWASFDGHLECVKWLLSIGSRIEDAVRTVPVLSGGERRHCVVCAHFGCQDSHGNTALMIACSGGQLEVVKYLLSQVLHPLSSRLLRGLFTIPQGANPKVKSEQSMTALLLAARQGEPKIVQYLLENNLASLDEHDSSVFV